MYVPANTIARIETIAWKTDSAIQMFANEIIVPIIETKENGIGRACIIYKIITLDLFFTLSPTFKCIIA